jgi:hypothetical protein
VHRRCSVRVHDPARDVAAPRKHDQGVAVTDPEDARHLLTFGDGDVEPDLLVARCTLECKAPLRIRDAGPLRSVVFQAHVRLSPRPPLAVDDAPRDVVAEGQLDVVHLAILGHVREAIHLREAVSGRRDERAGGRMSERELAALSVRLDAPDRNPVVVTRVDESPRPADGCLPFRIEHTQPSRAESHGEIHIPEQLRADALGPCAAPITRRDDDAPALVLAHGERKMPVVSRHHALRADDDLRRVRVVAQLGLSPMDRDDGIRVGTLLLARATVRRSHLNPGHDTPAHLTTLCRESLLDLPVDLAGRLDDRRSRCRSSARTTPPALLRLTDLLSAGGEDRNVGIRRMVATRRDVPRTEHEPRE